MADIFDWAPHSEDLKRNHKLLLDDLLRKDYHCAETTCEDMMVDLIRLYTWVRCEHAKQQREIRNPSIVLAVPPPRF